MSTELDALGDELLDEDSSYLDEAAVPSIPEGIPIDKSTNRVTLTLSLSEALLHHYSVFTNCSLCVCDRTVFWWMSLASLRFQLHKHTALLAILLFLLVL